MSKFVPEYPADDPFGIRREYPDPTPVAVPVEEGPFPNTLDALERQGHARQALAAQNIPETFEEADDFNIGEDYDAASPWELAADAATMTGPELFQAVYGISREDAENKLRELQRTAAQQLLADANLDQQSPELEGGPGKAGGKAKPPKSPPPLE